MVLVVLFLYLQHIDPSRLTNCLHCKMAKLKEVVLGNSRKRGAVAPADVVQHVHEASSGGFANGSQQDCLLFYSFLTSELMRLAPPQAEQREDSPPAFGFFHGRMRTTTTCAHCNRVSHIDADTFSSLNLEMTDATVQGCLDPRFAEKVTRCTRCTSIILYRTRSFRCTPI